MIMENEFSVLKIYLSSTDKFKFDLLYEHLVQKAKDFGISGVTVYRGIMGYGKSSHKINTSRFWELTEKLPVIIEMIDSTEKITQFSDMTVEVLSELPKGCLVTIQPIEIKIHKSGDK